MAIFNWKQFYTSVCITESNDMAIDRKELESITRQNYIDALAKHDLLGNPKHNTLDASSSAGSELIPTEYEAQKSYYKKKKRERQYGQAQAPVPILHERFRDVLEGKLDENAEPIQSLTKTYITMMENEGSDGDNWDRALEILYPEKEDK
jgi:hypothetical protein